MKNHSDCKKPTHRESIQQYKIKQEYLREEYYSLFSITSFKRYKRTIHGSKNGSG